MDELLAEFVAETREMLEAIEGEIIAWETDPADRARIDCIFRFVHTVKGNCGFFDFPRLAKLSHAAEDVLADCRAGRRDADSALVTAVLAIVDRIAEMIDSIEAGTEYQGGDDDRLIAALGSLDEATEGEETATTEIAPDAQMQPGDPVKRPDAMPSPRSIRLPVDLLDRVMSGVSDMVLARNDLGHRLRQAGNQPSIDGPFERLTAILTDVRDAITRMRMQRIETLFSALPRLVRDLSAELGKQVMIDIEGGDVELDREMVEMVRDPLVHIIRNAIDHGIEMPGDRLANGKRKIGMVAISARQSGNTIAIVVSDDGRGLDEEKIAAKAIKSGLISAERRSAMSRDAILQLIFAPGFSTAEEVSAVSGRGVGLDVVRDNLLRVGGSIKVTSQPGVGTLFTLQIPLTLSIIAGLTVEVGDQRFGIPQSYIEEIIHSSSNALDFKRVGDTALVTFRGNRVPCLMLHDVLGLPAGDIAQGDQTMVLLRLASGDLFALAVDRIHSHGDLVVKPLAPAIMDCELYAGSTLLDDGQPILLLDITSVASKYGLVSDARGQVITAHEDVSDDAAREISRAMLFTDHDGRRCAVRLELVKRIETASATSLDRTGKTTRVVIDDAILPIVGLPAGPVPSEKLRLLRLTDGDSEVLLSVRHVDDAVELKGELKQVNDDPLIEAVTLVGNKTVSLIDGHELFSRYGEATELKARPQCRLPGSEWARTILGPLVRSAGYEIADDSAPPKADGSEVSIMLEEEFEAAAALDIPILGPVIRLRDLPQSAPGQDTIYRYDREALIEALHKARAGNGAKP